MVQMFAMFAMATMMMGVVAGSGLVCMHSSDSKEMATSKCALAFEDNKVCKRLSSAVSVTCQQFSDSQICKAARKEHNEKCIGSWEVAPGGQSAILQDSDSVNLGEHDPATRGTSGYKGAYNATHVSTSPDNSGGGGIGSGTGRTCKTSSTGGGGNTCTSCDEEGSNMAAFIMTRPASNTGACWAYKRTPFVHCANIGSDQINIDIAEQETICTKSQMIEYQFNPNSISNAATKAHFASAAGLGGMAVAKCAGRKETVCEKNTSTNNLECTSSKDVKCMEVCKLTGWCNSGPDGVWCTSGSCDSDLCNGEYGRVACSPAAAML